MSLETVLNLTSTETKVLNIVTKAFGRIGSSMSVSTVSQRAELSYSYTLTVLKKLATVGVIKDTSSPTNRSYSAI